MAAAVPLVVVSEEGSGGDDGFSLDPAGVSLLQGLTGDIHVVAIGGAQRTGKSFLLSLLTSRGHDDVAARGSGFVVGNTQRACTVGIWVLKTVDMDGKTTVWLDTEGFASTSRSASYDARIFALALLLSSCFIYNSRGTIDSTAIADLSLVCELTKTIQVAASGADETGVQFAEYFPSFLWVVRDFTLAIVDPKSGKPRSSKWYIDTAWKEKSGSGQAPSNQVRRALRAFFPAKDCATCVAPLIDEKQLQRLPEIPLSELRPEFQRDLGVVRSKLDELLAAPKQLFGRNLTGSNLATLAQDYVDALNAGGVPTISSAWQRVVDTQVEEAVELAIAAYAGAATAAGGEEGSDDGAPLSVAEMAVQHNRAVSAALGAFDSNAIVADAGGPRLVACRERIVAASFERFAQQCKDNARASKAACVDLLAECAEEATLGVELKAAVGDSVAAALESAAADGDVGGDALSEGQTIALALRAHGECVGRVRSAFEARAKGPAQWEAWAEWQSTVGARVLSAAMRDVADGFRGRTKALKGEERARVQEIAVLGAKMEQAERLNDGERRALEGAMGEAARRAEIERRRLAELLEAKETEVKRVFEMRNLVVEAYQTQIEELKSSHAAEREAVFAAGGGSKSGAGADDKAEHFGLLKEHLEVTKMLLSQKEAEHTELEYQLGVTKAREAELQHDVFAAKEEAKLGLRVVGKLYAALGRSAAKTTKNFAARELEVVKKATKR